MASGIRLAVHRTGTKPDMNSAITIAAGNITYTSEACIDFCLQQQVRFRMLSSLLTVSVAVFVGLISRKTVRAPNVQIEFFERHFIVEQVGVVFACR
jgi:hypothetical protein